MTNPEQTPSGKPVHIAKIPASEATLLDYFAARAPREIPPWFMADPEPFDGPPAPDIPADISEEDRNMLRAWGADPIFDLPPEYEWYADAFEAHHAAKREQDEWHQMDRYYEWPWSWANSMLLTRQDFSAVQRVD